MTIKEYDIENLHCAECGSRIEAGIEKLPEVESANLDYENKRLSINYHQVVDDPLARLYQVAYSIDPGVVFSLHPVSMSSKISSLFWVFLGVGAGLLIAGEFLPYTFQPWIGVLGWFLVGHRVLAQAIKSLTQKKVFTEHFLMSIATIGALILGEYLEAGAVMIFYEFGEWLEGKALEHSRRMVKNKLNIKTEIAHLRTEDDIQDKPLSAISAGDVIIIYPGERVPLDGIIIKGESSVDTSSLTGESEPLYVGEGTVIYAGFLNNSGMLELQVKSVASESTIGRILKLIENAGVAKSTQEKFITRFARFYTPAVVGAALLVFLIPTLLGAEAAIWFKISLVFLIVSCPCALVISIPLTFFIGIGNAAKMVIIVKGSGYLDILRQVRTIVFDKTGTLTTGEMQIEKVYVNGDFDPEMLLEILWLCEYNSSHPFARAIKNTYQGKFNSQQVKAYSEFPGKGIIIIYGKDRLIAGSEDFLTNMGFLDLVHPPSQSVVHLAKNSFYLGCITFSDEVKSGMKETIANLKKRWIRKTIMLSGDRTPKAEKVAKELGIDEFYAELLPDQKLAKLEEIIKTSDGKTAFVGDGLNDAPALARADVGIAMGGIGNQASIESADIVLLNDRPQQLVEAFNISYKVGNMVTQNIIIALGIKVLIMLLGLLRIAGLWEAVLGDVGVTILVIFNSLRLLRYKSNA